ncbi:unnamed protein product [Larinioides sclopetarius]|uniref:Eukaryotic translation initiation factor 4 gamma 3 n=1 Tax=Larinioides sclopetarius TaxID=280406 RepID=A0AAV1ZAG4_9ARAC
MATPQIDPKTGKNLDKRAEERITRSNTEKASENSDSNICLQLASQLVAFLNGSESDIASKQSESVRINSKCSYKNEGKEMQETSFGEELVDENISDPQHTEVISEVDITEGRNLINKEEVGDPCDIKDKISNTTNDCESGTTKSVDLDVKTKDKKQNAFEVPIEFSIPDIEEPVKNEEKIFRFNKTEKINNANSSIDSGCSSSAQESTQPVAEGAKEEFAPPSSRADDCSVRPKKKKDSFQENSDANICLQLTTQLAAFLNDSPCDVTFKQQEPVIAIVASLLLLLREKQRKAPYGYTSPALSSVASNSGHDINKQVATAQEGMHSNAGMSTPAQHHQSIREIIASPQPIIQQGQQISRNTIAMQQYPQRAYNTPQYPIMANQHTHTQYLWNYNTPPPQNSNGYFPSHGMSSYQSMPPQMPPQSIPAQPQPQHTRKGADAIPLIDPKTGKNVLTVDKNAEDSSSRPNSKKESENSDSNICVQFAEQVAAVLNDSRTDIVSKQPEPVRIDTLCSHEHEELRVLYTPSGKIKKTKKKKDLNKQSESKEGGKMDAFLDTKEGVALSLVSSPPPIAAAAPTSVSILVSERNPSPELITDSENLNSIPMSEENPDTTPQTDISPWESTSEASSVSINTDRLQQNKIVFKFSYKEDQWSPLNPEGKKHYDREFLLYLQSQPLSLCKPNNLPNLSVIKDKAHIHQLPKLNRTPSPPVVRGSQRKKGKKSKKIKSLSVDQIIELHKSPNPWRPLHKCETPLNEKDRLKRSVLSVLNKLTPQKFETLLAQLKNLLIDTEEKLSLVSDLVFEKAVYEPMFSAVYANLSKHLALIKRPASGVSGTQVNFRKLLLTKCQTEFEQDRSHELEEKMNNLKAADPEQRKKLQLEYDEEKKKIRHRELGNIRFIGELFKLGMLIEPILHEMIEMLLHEGNDESLEDLSRLLKTIGKELDDAKSTKNSHQAAYYPRNSVPPRAMQTMARNPIGAVVNQPGQQPSSQYAPMPTMVPLQPNFTSFPPTMVSPQFQQMYQQRAYNTPHYPIMANQKYLRNYNTPPPQNSNGYFPSHGMSSYQSMPPQMPPQSIPAQPQPQHTRKGADAIPLIDPKTGKNVLTVDKNAEDSSSRPNSKKESMDKYFDQMKLIVAERMTSSRVRFLLQDVIDLRKNNWLPRRPESNPKAIKEIHKEAELEAIEQELCKNVTNKRKNTSEIDSFDDSRTSSSESNKNSNLLVNPSKLKLTKPDEVESIRLGPVGRCLQTFERDISSGILTTDYDKTALTNKFPNLAEQSPSSNFEEKRLTASSSASNEVCNKECLPAIRKTPSSSKERENMLETANWCTRTSEAKASEIKSTVQVFGNAATTKGRKFVVNRFLIYELALNSPQYNKDDMQGKTKTLIEKFLFTNDFEEAIKNVTELASPNTVHMFIDAAVNQVLEKSCQARYCLGQLLSSLFKKKIITFEQYKKGFAGVLEIIDDYALDIPLIWDYMGEILEPMIEDIETPFKLLKEVLQPCIPSEKAGMLVSSILHRAAKRKDTIKLGEVWRESGVQWTDIIGTHRNVAEFIEKHKLEFTTSPTKVNLQTQMSMEEMKKHLLSLLEKNAELEEVFDWVDANVPDTSGPTFVRALVAAVHESCLSGSGTTWELNTSKLKSRIPLISRYVSTNEKLQLQALYAVQALMNQLGQPSGLLHQFFDVLYDDDVISDESFKEWEQSDDPNEAEGKGVAVHSVKSFFAWLREPAEETEEMNSV